MKAVILTGAGGPEVLSIGEVPKPEVKPGYIRVKVRAAGINRADLLQRMGHYPAPPGWPADIPGLEYAGEVEAVRETDRWKVGDRVMGLVGGGAYAEMVTVHAEEALAVPEGLSFAEAAAIPEVFLTAYDALVTRGRLRPGERVLIHAVGSGVGTAAAQIAKHLGAVVLGTSRSADKLARALVYGLDIGIDTSETPFRAGADGAGARHPRFDRRSGLRRQSRGARPAGAAGAARLSRRVPHHRRPRSDRPKPAGGDRHGDAGAHAWRSGRPLIADFAQRMLPLFDRRIEQAAPLRPVLQTTFPMERIADAHRLLESNETFGKVVVEW